MVFAFNYSFELSGVAILIVVLAFLKIQYPEGNSSTVAFRRYVLMMLAAEIVDIAAAVMCNHAERFGIPLCSFINAAYFAALALVEYFLVDYIRTRVKENWLSTVLNGIDTVVVVVYLLLVLSNSFTGWIFYFEDYAYYRGSAHVVVYLMPGYYMTSAMIRVFANTDSFTRKEYVSYLCFVFVLVLGMFLQGVVFPSVLLTFFSGSIGILVLLFGLETPDYPKLVRTMDELEYLKLNLEKEVQEQTALAVRRKNQVERMSIDTVKALARAIDAKDDYTRGHSARVAEYSRLLACKLGWDEERVEELYQAALLHDIGKIGVPDTILNKPSRLEDTEYEVVRSHTLVGASILKRVPSLPEAMTVARSHHERYDGHGYPDGLAGEDIPLSARVVALADSFDAMSSQRVYRKALSRERIIEELKKGRGSQFDPQLLDVFCEMYQNGALDDILGSGSVGGTSSHMISENYAKVQFANLNGEDLDYLSGLPTRYVAERTMSEAMATGSGWMLLVDLDNLGQINSSNSYKAGDMVIVQVADLLTQVFQDGTVSRIGGDEFLCFAPDISRIELERRVLTLAARCKSAGQESEITLSVGVCESRKGDVFSIIFTRADKALYHAKRSGKARCCLYQINGTETADGELDLNLTDGNVEDDSLTASAGTGKKPGVFDVQDMLAPYLGFSDDVTLMMITLKESTGQILYIDEIEQAMSCMELAIRESIRSVDASARYSGVQHLVALVGANETDTVVVVDRIFKAFYRNYNSSLMQPSYSIEGITSFDRQLIAS